MEHVLRLGQIRMADLAAVGGKAARLGDLTGAGFPVPPGFCVTIRAFDSCCGSADSIGPVQIGPVPAGVAGEILEAYRRLGGGAVAVRSSATGEDAQEFSFAGQYGSFLQVVGEERLLEAVRGCWASLRSARALDYRRRLASGGPEPKMAVIVQAMVSARVSGVMFTANPVTSDRGEIVISAYPGLGTLVVSGQVSPDGYRLNKATLRVREREIAQKAQMAIPADEGIRLVPVSPGRCRASTLSRRECSALGRLGRRIEDHFGSPQDVEFAHDGERFCVVQSRPITGLVSWGEPKKGTAFSRHSFMEFIPRPVSPLFETTYLPLVGDALRRIAAEFGIVVRGGAPAIVTINGYAFFRVDAYLSVLHLAAAPLTWARYLSNLWRHRWRRTLLAPYVRAVATWQGLDAHRATPQQLWLGVIETCRAGAAYWRACMQNRVSGLIEENVLRLYPLLVPESKRVPAQVLLRGHDSEPARAEREFRRLADQVRRSPELRALFAERPAQAVESALQANGAGREWLSRLHAYLARSGHQVSNLDFMEPTLGDSPVPLLASIKQFLDDPSPISRPEEVREERLAAEARLLTSLGPLRRTLVSWMLALLGYGLVLREDVLFFLGLGWPLVRRFILELGARMVRQGLLDDRADVFFLTQEEVKSASGETGAILDGAGLRRDVTLRRERWKRQLRLKPPVLIPSSYGFLGMRLSRYMPERAGAATGNRICGSGVSPGRVTAPASVIGSLEEFERMRSGSVLVAPMMSPAWTPILAMATGVVTDVGGLLSHTSIVAREYGIPAVIGTGVATRRIADGQTVTLDGDQGCITLGEPLPA